MSDQDQDPSKTLAAVLDSLLVDRRRLLNLLILLSSLAVLGLLVAWLVLVIARSNRLEINQTASGGVVYRIGGEETLTFLLAASSPWASTGFTVRKGQHLDIRASGRVSLAIHHLVDSAVRDVRPVHAWVDPDGMAETHKRLLQQHDLFRQDFLLTEKGPYGALVAGVSSSALPPESDDVFFVGSNWNGMAEKSGTLWFAVNDVLLAQDREKVYEVPGQNREPSYSVPRPFLEIAQDRYWNLWYDDNVGSFMINVQVHR